MSLNAIATPAAREPCLGDSLAKPELARKFHDNAVRSLPEERATEIAWPEEAPFHMPVFVVTHEKRDLWERPGGITFHFFNDGIETALDVAYWRASLIA